MLNSPASANTFAVHTAGISSVIPSPHTTITAFRARTTFHPRFTSRLEIQPPRKLPASAATNGIQNASTPSSSRIFFETRYTANQSVMKNQIGSVSAFPMMMPHVSRIRTTSRSSAL